MPTEEGPSPARPALFREVGPSVDDWEKYLRNMAEDLDKQHADTSLDISSAPTRQENHLFLQVEHLWYFWMKLHHINPNPITSHYFDVFPAQSDV